MAYPTATVQEIFDEARSIYLNDADAKVYKNDKLLPFYKTAYDRYQVKLLQNALSTLDAVDTPKVITAGSTTYGTLPSDFAFPLKMEERLNGSPSTTLYTPMIQSRWVQNVAVNTELNLWAFRADGIEFPGASTDRQVRLYYKRLYPQVPAQSGDPIIDVSTIAYGHAKTALAAKIAGLLQRHINQNITLADSAD